MKKTTEKTTKTTASAKTPAPAPATPAPETKSETKSAPEKIAPADFESKLRSIIKDGYTISRVSPSGATIEHGEKHLTVRYRPYGYRINLKGTPAEATKKLDNVKVVENSGKVAKSYPFSVYVKVDDAMTVIAQNI